MASSSPKKLSVTLRPCPPSKFGHQVFDFEQMTTESYAKKQLNVNDGSIDTETA
jgi:hypothetical protein